MRSSVVFSRNHVRKRWKTCCDCWRLWRSAIDEVIFTTVTAVQQRSRVDCSDCISVFTVLGSKMELIYEFDFIHLIQTTQFMLCGTERAWAWEQRVQVYILLQSDTLGSSYAKLACINMVNNGITRPEIEDHLISYRERVLDKTTLGKTTSPRAATDSP